MSGNKYFEIGPTASGKTLSFDDSGVLLSGGGGVPVLRGPFNVTWDSDGLANPGVQFYTPVVGDVLLDAWIKVGTAFDGATPSGDIGSFIGGPTGMFFNMSGVVDMSIADTEVIDDGLVSQGGGGSTTSDLLASAFYKAPQRALPAIWTSANPLFTIVSQNGQAAVNSAFTVGASLTLPLTVVTGVNDTFVYTNGLSTAETFTVSAGTYNRMVDLEAALNFATGTTTSTFDSIAEVYDNGNTWLYVQLFGVDGDVGAQGNSSTITPGPTDITAQIGFANPQTFEGGSGGASGSTQGSFDIYLLTVTPSG